MTTADVLINKLKRAAIARFNKQLKALQIGHIYKEDKILTDAIDAIEYAQSPHTIDVNVNLILTQIHAKITR